MSRLLEHLTDAVFRVGDVLGGRFSPYSWLAQRVYDIAWWLDEKADAVSAHKARENIKAGESLIPWEQVRKR